MSTLPVNVGCSTLQFSNLDGKLRGLYTYIPNFDVEIYQVRICAMKLRSDAEYAGRFSSIKCAFKPLHLA